MAEMAGAAGGSWSRRDRARGLVTMVLALGLLAVTGCATPSTSSGASSSAAGSGGETGLPSSSDVPVSPVVGTVSSVDPPARPSPAASPTKAPTKPSARPSAKPSPATPKPTAAPVLGFTLMSTDGQTLTFTMGDLDDPAEFPPSSLYDRLSNEDPIRVFFTIEGDTLVVYHIEDAG